MDRWNLINSTKTSFDLEKPGCSSIIKVIYWQFKDFNDRLDNTNIL